MAPKRVSSKKPEVKHEGKGPGQLNIPMLALASGLLKTRPGVQSNFGNELGEGLGRMGEAMARGFNP